MEKVIYTYLSIIMDINWIIAGALLPVLWNWEIKYRWPELTKEMSPIRSFILYPEEIYCLFIVPVLPVVVTWWWTVIRWKNINGLVFRIYWLTEKINGMLIGKCMSMRKEPSIFRGCGAKAGMWKQTMIYVMPVRLIMEWLGINQVESNMNFLSNCLMQSMPVVCLKTVSWLIKQVWVPMQKEIRI